MRGFSILFITLWHASLGESLSGEIINFEPPGLNDWLDRVIVRETDVYSSYRNGKLVKDPKLDLFSVKLERYCAESFEVPQVTQLQWYNPQKIQCKTKHYYVLKLLYNNFNIDCLRLSSVDKDEVMFSIKPIVIKRFYLKVYYLTTSGACYVKYFELPIRECSHTGHVKLPSTECTELFPLLSKDIWETSSDHSDAVVTVVK